MHRSIAPQPTPRLLDPLDPSTPVTVSDDALPAPQINGVVWSQAMIGNFVYVGGSFSNARPAGSPAGQNTVARGNFLAFNVTTGQLMTNVTHSFNAQVRSVFASPDKTKLYVAGEFTTVNGRPGDGSRSSPSTADTGALTLTGFAPSVNYDVDAVVATNSKVFVGGSFLGVGNADRQYLAAFNAGTGTLLDWAPQATGGTGKRAHHQPRGHQGRRRRLVHRDERLERPGLRPGHARHRDRRRRDANVTRCRSRSTTWSATAPSTAPSPA